MLILQVSFSAFSEPQFLPLDLFRYHQGDVKAPILTIFIGGNHEASNHLQELSYGGWVAPNIYYLGYAGVVRVNGIRIGGISGIFRGYNFEKGHFEITPYDDETVRSVYSIRKLEVFKLSQLTPSKVDIMLSHDWPNNIWEHGDNSHTGTKSGLLRFKPAFKQDMDSGRLGSRPTMELLKTLKPKFWFSAHMHCRFDAIVKHDEEEQQTKFVALDKCLPKRNCFEFIDIGEEVERDEDGNAILDFQYDPEWLAILKLTNTYLNCTPQRTMIPMEPRYGNGKSPNRWKFTPTPEEIARVERIFKGDFKIPENFTQITHGYNPDWEGTNFGNLKKPQAVLNPQTQDFCDRLGIDDPLYIAATHQKIDIKAPSFGKQDTAFKEACPPKPSLELPKPVNSEEINLDEESLDGEEDSVIDTSALSQANITSYSQTSTLSLKRSSDTEQPASPPKTSPVVASGSAKKFKRRNQELRDEEDDD